MLSYHFQEVDEENDVQQGQLKQLEKEKGVVRSNVQQKDVSRKVEDHLVFVVHMEEGINVW